MSLLTSMNLYSLFVITASVSICNMRISCSACSNVYIQHRSLKEQASVLQMFAASFNGMEVEHGPKPKSVKGLHFIFHCRSKSSELLSSSSEPLSKASEALTNDSETLTNDSEALTNDSEALTNDSEALTNDSEMLTSDSETLTSGSESLSRYSDTKNNS